MPAAAAAAASKSGCTAVVYLSLSWNTLCTSTFLPFASLMLNKAPLLRRPSHTAWLTPLSVSAAGTSTGTAAAADDVPPPAASLAGAAAPAAGAGVAAAVAGLAAEPAEGAVAAVAVAAGFAVVAVVAAEAAGLSCSSLRLPALLAGGASTASITCTTACASTRQAATAGAICQLGWRAKDGAGAACSHVPQQQLTLPACRFGLMTVAWSPLPSLTTAR